MIVTGTAAVTAAQTATGGLLILVVVRDIFHTLLHPAGRGRLSRIVMRGTWCVARRSGPRTMVLAGPLTLLLVIAVWTLLTVVGWALVYLPHLPAGFSYATGLDPAQRSSIVDAMYVSLVVVATLGLGDVVPTTGWLRLAVPLEAMLGFALLTASVTWILQLYPALGRRRALAVRLRLLGGQDAAALPPSVLHALAAELSAVRVDLLQYTESYYFHDGPQTSLARVLPATLTLARTAAGDGEPQRRVAGEVMRRAVDELADHLDSQYLGVQGTADDVLAAYGREHGQT